MSLRARLLLIACFCVVAAVCARLGIWQLQRLKERRSANEAAQAARSAPVVGLDGGSPTSSIANRRVRATGSYDHAHDIVLRGRPHRGIPGVEIVSPLLLREGNVAVLVNRGFVPAPDAITAHPDSLREPGEVTVEGIALPIDSGRGEPLQRNQQTTWARLDLPALRSSLPYRVEPVYIRQSPATNLPRFPRRLDAPPLDDGPHLSYAIQWFAFAILAVVFGIVILRQKSRER
jgi:surfeit locus 1 family protein